MERALFAAKHSPERALSLSLNGLMTIRRYLFAGPLYEHPPLEFIVQKASSFLKLPFIMRQPQ